MALFIAISVFMGRAGVAGGEGVGVKDQGKHLVRNSCYASANISYHLNQISLLRLYASPIFSTLRYIHFQLKFQLCTLPSAFLHTDLPFVDYYS